jgi:hypothetical protein
VYIFRKDGAQMGERRKETAYIQDNKKLKLQYLFVLGGSVAAKLDLPPK